MWRRRQLKKWFPVEVDTERKPKVPQGWADPIIHSWHVTGLFGRMARDAIAHARAQKRFEDANLFRAMLDQFADFAGE